MAEDLAKIEGKSFGGVFVMKLNWGRLGMRSQSMGMLVTRLKNWQLEKSGEKIMKQQL